MKRPYSPSIQLDFFCVVVFRGMDGVICAHIVCCLFEL